MYLKTLELFGFKSFPSKTSLKFDPGITVVVGPNGCGKSNIFDAIKWALGEQSAKSLRGTRMEDIIFNGTDNYPSLNYSEVSLIFSNEDNYLPIAYKEVAVTRRLYRSGESQYFINKSPARLKDVQGLFLGTGIGDSSYSFVEQGKIEALLNYKPEEKRLIFDEASGIVKYKQRKKEALRKLESTQNNLLRLDDIINEVKRQVLYLEKQVEKAKKYKQTNQELITVEQQIAYLQTQDLSRQEDAFLDQINDYQLKLKKEQEKLASFTAKKKELNNHYNNLRQRLEQVNSLVASLYSRIEGKRSHIEINNQRITEAKRRLNSLEYSQTEAEKRIQLQIQRIEQETRALTNFDNDIEKAQTELSDLEQAKQEKRKLIDLAKKDVASSKQEILHCEQKHVQLNNVIVEMNTHRKNISSRKKRLNIDNAKLENYLQEHRQHYKTVCQQQQQLQTECSDLRQEYSILKKQLRDVDSVNNNLEKQRVEKEKTLIELYSYLEFLKNLRIKYEKFPVSQEATIVFKQKPPKINKLIASLEDSELKEVNNQGQSEFHAQVEAKIISLPEEELTQRIEKINQHLSEIQKKLQQNNNQKDTLTQTIEQQDAFLASKNQLYHQKTNQKESIKKQLDRYHQEQQLLLQELDDCSKQLQDIEGKYNTQQQDLDVIDRRLSQAKTKLEKSQQDIDNYSDLFNELEIKAARKESEINSLQERKDSMQAKIDILKEEEENLRINLGTFHQEQHELNERIAKISQELSSCEAAIDDCRQQIDKSKDKKEVLNEEFQKLQLQEQKVAAIIKKVDDNLEQIKGHLHTKKMQMQKINFEKGKVLDYLKQVYAVEFDAAKIKHPEVSKAELEIRRNRLKKRRDNLGKVNLVAIDEFQELNERYDFLTKQRQDLVDSKDSLSKAIRKINRTSKEVFLDVFYRVEKEFKKNFRFLFAGGRAQLVLLDKENVLESGVTIEVQPPGKKLQSVSLLSGGEKALTAIALIFAIFQIRPSPLCVLDEIDAPLDEANVDRFNQLLKQFADNAQFITITHNKRTMGNADVLYGVTMQQRGISKLVSVKFAEEVTA